MCRNPPVIRDRWSIFRVGPAGESRASGGRRVDGRNRATPCGGACDTDEIRNNAAMSNPVRTFSEREFYLEEFHGRTIGIAWPAEENPESEPLTSVIDELVNNESQVVLFSPLDEILAIAGGGPPVDLDEENAGPHLWRRLRENGSAGMRVSADRFESDCERAFATPNQAARDASPTARRSLRTAVGSREAGLRHVLRERDSG